MKTSESRIELELEEHILRPPTMDDLDATVALLNRCSLEAVGIAEFRTEEMRVEWDSPGFDLESDARLVLTPDGDLVGYIEVWDPSPPHVQVQAWGKVDPEHRGQGIGTHLLAFAEQRARQAVRKAPSDARVVLLNGALSTAEDAQALFEQRGFQRVRHFYRMLIEMDERPEAPQWGLGLDGSKEIRFRTFEPGLERAVVQAVRDAFQDHWGYVERPFAEDLRMWTHIIETDEDFDPTLWFLAMDGDEIAGISLCWPKREGYPDMGWVGTLGVLRPWRRRGLGLALLLHSFGELYDRGRRQVGLGVDADSLTGATRLYEKAGMRVDRRYDTYEKELRPGAELRATELADE